MKTTDRSYIVIGNQSGDLDSTVSTLAMAQLLKEEISSPVIPLMRNRKEDFRLKPEIPALLSYADIGEDLLIFQSSPQGQALLSSKHSQYVLVDHNTPEGIGDEKSIAGIIDHHKDEGFLPDLSFRIIRPCGSCASLISREWQKKQILPDKTTALLLSAAIIIDTGNFSPSWDKTTELDRKQFEHCRNFLTQRDLNFLKTLPGIKQDLSSLSAGDLLQRDYKEIPRTRLRGGICSLPRSQEAFFHSPFYSDQVIRDFMQAKGIEILFLMHTIQEPFKREFSYCINPDAIPEEISHPLRETLLSREDIRFQRNYLKTPPTDYSWVFFRQEDSKASRKILLPILRQILEEIGSGSP